MVDDLGANGDRSLVIDADVCRNKWIDTNQSCTECTSRGTVLSVIESVRKVIHCMWLYFSPKQLSLPGCMPFDFLEFDPFRPLVHRRFLDTLPQVTIIQLALCFVERRGNVERRYGAT